MLSAIECSREAQKCKLFWIAIIFVTAVAWLAQQISPQARVCHKLGGDYSLFDGGCVTVNPDAGYLTA